MENRILVLGCNGMLGHMVSLYLKEKGFEVCGFARKESPIVDTVIGDATDFEFLKKLIVNSEFDYVINCIGVLNRACDVDPCNAILMNSYLPHFLAEITRGMKTKIIHISTDCVFSGDKGSYLVDDKKDAQTLYGISKSLGELNDNKNITIRTSIIGPDLNEKGIGLFNWFIHQEKANGFKNVYWTGLTTLTLAKIIYLIIDQEPNLSGIYNVVPDEKISKYDLLSLLRVFNAIEITPLIVPVSDKSLVSNFMYSIIDYSTQIRELYDWIKTHDIYER